VQALPDMLEILPIGASKGAGVQMLVDHMEVPIEQVKKSGIHDHVQNSVCLVI
jgi:hydroxymethylpyrimidine pyrophosphatase-like HAD family hydrolase